MIPADRLEPIASLIDERARLSIRRIRPQARKLTPEYRAAISMWVPVDDANELRAVLGGSVHADAQHAKARWELISNPAIALLAQLIPLMRRQREQAECLVALGDLRAASVAYRDKRVGTRTNRAPQHMHRPFMHPGTYAQNDAYVARCEELYRRVRRLNTALEER